jgi:hypothetical protein
VTISTGTNADGSKRSIPVCTASARLTALSPAINGTESCHKLEDTYTITKKSQSFSDRSRPPKPCPRAPSSTSTPGGNAAGRKATEEVKEESPPSEQDTSSKAPTGEQVRVTFAIKVKTIVDESDEVQSLADESDDLFAMFETLATTDEDVFHSLAQVQARKTAAQWTPEEHSRPIPISSRPGKNMARMAKTDLKWTKHDYSGGNGEKWDSNQTQIFDELANQASIYPNSSSRTLCPDSGATSTMCPHADMFIDYQDIRHEDQYVRLGDENKRILVHGRGTMCFALAGKKITYADTLHVPELSAILLSTRVHRRSAQGCSFLADNSGCFLTYPHFQVEIEDDEDCTIECSSLPKQTHTFDFDSRLHVDHNTSAESVRRSHNLAFRTMHRGRLLNVQKSQAHLHDGKLTFDDSGTFPTMPVHAVPNSGSKLIEGINSSELKKYFGCRGLSDWSILEDTDTGLHVVKDSDAPPSLGNITTISHNNHGKLLQRPPTALHTVRMDIGYGEGTSPGGYKYALTLVDYATHGILGVMA